MSARDFFLGKRIAVIGLGSQGAMLSDIKYLVKANALVSVYDLQNEANLSGCMPALHSLGLANCLCGSVPPEDLLDMDLIILSHEYPRNSSFLGEARKRGIQVEYPETLFLKLAPPIMVVGVMGACGKATVLSMLAPMLEAASVGTKQSSFVIDPESEGGILAHLKTLKNGDTVAMRVAPHMMPEIHALKWSPQIAVFATIPPVGSYSESPFEILAHQTYNNYVIGSDRVVDAVRASNPTLKAKMLRTKASLVPEEWLPKARATYERENAALALQAARLFKVSDEAAREALSRWKPLKGRLEPLKKIKNIEFWNDSASISPHATMAGLSAVSTSGHDLVLIMGGADSGADYKELYATAGRYAHTVVLLPGSGTMRERRALREMDGLTVLSAPSVEEAVRSAMDHANKGDKVLFSPAFEAGGIDRSRHERGERFVRAVRSL